MMAPRPIYVPFMMLLFQMQNLLGFFDGDLWVGDQDELGSQADEASAALVFEVRIPSCETEKVGYMTPVVSF